MNILHWVRSEDSGLLRSTLELAVWEEKAGHAVCVHEPSKDKPLYGERNGVDIHSIHSQIDHRTYHDGKAKFLWCHGEPLSSVANRVSMKAIVDLASITDCFICMRREEQAIWNSIKRTYCVPKGVDLERFRALPEEEIGERLSGEPAVLYCENWRGERNPLYACVAMQEVWKRFPDARLHLYNCQDQRMLSTFTAMYHHAKWWPFLRSIQGPVKDVNHLYNRAHIVVSCLYPLYARTVVESLAVGRAAICPGYREPGYPYTCELEPGSMAAAIIKAWEEWGKFDFRKHAESTHDIKETVRQAVQIYGRYL